MTDARGGQPQPQQGSATHTGGGQGDPKEGEIHLDVIAAEGGGGAPPFSLSERPGEDQYLEADNVLNMKKARKKFRIFYRLVDNSGLGLRFQRDKRDALWVQEGECPRSECHHDEFKAVRVSPEELEVKNENTAEQRYSYTLRFQDREGRPVDFDPVIINNGGGNIE